LLTIDLRTGQQIDCFSSVNISNAVCENAQLLDDMEGRSRKDADILFVGRTDYRLTIHTPSTALYSTSAPGLGESVTDDKRSGFQEITYSTYTPNSFDKPLAEFWAKAGSNQRMWEEDGTEAKSTRIVIGHDGVIVGVENGGGVKWVKALGSVGIGVYDVLLPLSPLTAKPIIIPQPPPDLESLLPLPSNPDQQHFDIRAKSPSTYIGSVPLQLALPGPDGAPTRAPEKPILYALSSHSYPLINFVPTAQPGQHVNSSFPLSEDTPDKDRLLPYMIDPAAEEKTIDPAPETLLDGLQRRTGRAGRWIFWVIGVLAALVLAGFGVAGLIGRKTIKQTATPPNEKEPLLVLTESEKPRISFADDTAGESSSITKPVHSAEVKEDDKPKKKNGRRRVRGKKKRSDSHAPKDGGDDDDDDRSSVASPVKGDKPLPDLPRAMSSTALEDDNDKERLAISDNVIGELSFERYKDGSLADSQATALTVPSYSKGHGAEGQSPSSAY
jgi:serine/threonine-protein kinase/endoribonuclease IRE1